MEEKIGPLLYHHHHLYYYYYYYFSRSRHHCYLTQNNYFNPHPKNFLHLSLSSHTLLFSHTTHPINSPIFLSLSLSFLFSFLCLFSFFSREASVSVSLSAVVSSNSGSIDNIYKAAGGLHLYAFLSSHDLRSNSNRRTGL